MRQSHDAYADAIERAQTLVDAAKWDAALKEARAALASEPDSSDAHRIVGLCHYMLSNYKEAYSAAKLTLQYDPEEPWGYWLLAVTCERQNRYKEALHAIDKAIELDTEEGAFHSARALILLNSNRPEPALKSAEEALRLDPDDTEAKQVRTLALSNLGRHSEAGQEALDNLRIASDEFTAWYARAQQLFLQGSIDEARKAILEALRLNPEDEDAQSLLMRILGARHSFFGLFWRWTIFLHKFPPQARTAMIIGIIIVMRVFRAVANSTPMLRPVLVPIIALWVLFCIYTWVSQPLFKLAVRKGWIR